MGLRISVAAPNFLKSLVAIALLASAPTARASGEYKYGPNANDPKSVETFEALKKTIKSCNTKKAKTKDCYLSELRKRAGAARTNYRAALKEMSDVARGTIGLGCNEITADKPVARTRCYEKTLDLMISDVRNAREDNEGLPEHWPARLILEDWAEKGHFAYTILGDICTFEMGSTKLERCFDANARALQNQLVDAGNAMSKSFDAVAEFSMLSYACGEAVGASACSADRDWEKELFIGDGEVKFEPSHPLPGPNASDSKDESKNKKKGDGKKPQDQTKPQPEPQPQPEVTQTGTPSENPGPGPGPGPNPESTDAPTDNPSPSDNPSPRDSDKPKDETNTEPSPAPSPSPSASASPAPTSTETPTPTPTSTSTDDKPSPRVTPLPRDKKELLNDFPIQVPTDSQSDKLDCNDPNTIRKARAMSRGDRTQSHWVSYEIALLGQSVMFACQVAKNLPNEQSALFLAEAVLRIVNSTRIFLREMETTDIGTLMNSPVIQDWFIWIDSEIDAIAAMSDTPAKAELAIFRAFVTRMKTESRLVLFQTLMDSSATGTLGENACPFIKGAETAWRDKLAGAQTNGPIQFPRVLIGCR